MKQLTNALKDRFITRQSAIHDSHNTAATTATLTTTPAKYTNDGVARQWKTETLWNTTTNIVDCSALAVGSKIDVILDSLIASGNQGAIISVEFRCPNNGSPFVMKTSTLEVAKNVAFPAEIAWKGYIGDEVQEFGIEIYSSVLTGTVTLSERKLLVRA